MFDYLQALDKNKSQQSIGAGEPIFVTINLSTRSNSQIIDMTSEDAKFDVEIYIRYRYDDKDICYETVHIKDHKMFCNEEWSKYFDGIWSNVARYLDLDTVELILKHCTRLSKLNVFW